MHQRLFGRIHQRRTQTAVIVIKVAVVVGAFFLFGQANVLFSLGIPALVLPAGLLVAIAILAMWPNVHDGIAVPAQESASAETKAPHVGILLHSAARYDALAWLLNGGRERAFRQRILSFARLKPGDAVLDVGCGTGTIALLAKQKVGPNGRVAGIDASGEMVARAMAKAERAKLPIAFSTGTAQDLPYKDGEFDVVLSTLMFHHLPKRGREEFCREALRVLRPNGRLVIIDFAKPLHRRSFFRFHRHGQVDVDRVAIDLEESGFNIAERGEVGTKGLCYLVAQPVSSMPSQEATQMENGGN
ncbi:class I SAM-dependent methyltransferase [Rhizobium leguminosarum]|uniref:class I SAM-dependent methyltransferase n=1 Tax=Rhizobium leguminosarum TaxID=384 RepID=UPI001C941B3F|nr:class I SAM-dependent methyltransferase [Rhizobium leguminosarum]MBY5351786.1 class I SAM-dependent methyltransferase [Rhizobium leguminosarum]